jgi:hypothetical protein
MTSQRFDRNNLADLIDAVHLAVEETPVTDMHTHLFAPEFGGLLLSGIDEMLTYHYLVAEYFRVAPAAYEAFLAKPKPEQAEAIWQALFIEQTPLGEACRGVLTALDRLGCDVSNRDLAAIRAWYAAQDVHEIVDKVFAAANVRDVVMTNDPFDPIERAVWEKHMPAALDKRFHRALRIDPLLTQWPACTEALRSWGYEVTPELHDSCLAEVKRFLEEWVALIEPLYMAVSLPPDFAYPDDSPRTVILDRCILPVARAHDMPFAMMIGVKRRVNPALQLAGDGVGRCSLAPVEALCRRYPANKFMFTTLSREDQHTACVVARKFRNLLPFGCWWFLNNPSLIEEMTRMRVELLGPTTVPQHSDARVLDQIVYKWAHSRAIIAKVLAEKYVDVVETGWVLTEEEIRADVARMLGGNFWRFLDFELV